MDPLGVGAKNADALRAGKKKIDPMGSGRVIYQITDEFSMKLLELRPTSLHEGLEARTNLQCLHWVICFDAWSSFVPESILL